MGVSWRSLEVLADCLQIQNELQFIHSSTHSLIHSLGHSFSRSPTGFGLAFQLFFLSFRICVNPTRPDSTPFIQRMLVQFFTWHHPFPSNGLVDKQHNLRDLIWFYLFDSFVCRLQRVNNYKLAFARWASDSWHRL